MKIENLSVSYGKNQVYKDFNLEVEEGKITCILGESGCGKTTLLNSVAGLIPYAGEIEKVKTSYVFQTPRLVPNLTVFNNLKLIGADDNAINEMLKRVGLSDKVQAYPKTLSGGEAQRVSLCRAFLYNCDMLLLDEPFSSLDLKTKLSAMQLFKELLEGSGKTALFVTHDIDEALYLADKIEVLTSGKISAEFKNEDKKDFGNPSPLRREIVSALLK